MPGYTGHIPKIHMEEHFQKIDYNKHIPGYNGYIPSIKSENLIGQSYGKITCQSLKSDVSKGNDIPHNVRYTTTMRDAFIDQKNVKIQSTAELLGVSSRKDIYKKVDYLFIQPIPIDTINKFWGIDSKQLQNDEVVQKQSFEESYKYFWSFIEANKVEFVDKPPENFSKSKDSFWGVNKESKELHPDMNIKPIPGYQGWNRSIYSENVYGLSYEHSRKKAEEILIKINTEKAHALLKSSKY